MRLLKCLTFDGGCIFKQMEDALDYSLNILNIIQTNIVGKNRIDTPYFDAEAFREAWFNAVCHNLWVEKTPPAIYGFDDRVEIISYGLLKDGMTKDEFFNGVSKPVNEEFAKIFMQLNYMEQSGKGVPTVVSKYGKDVYHFGSSFIQCILPYNILDKTKQERLLGRNEVDNEVEKDDTLETRIISLIKENAYISKAKMAEKTGKSVSTIERLLRKSTQIVRIGGAKGGHWEVKD